LQRYDLPALLQQKTQRRRTIILRPITPTAAFETDLHTSLIQLARDLIRWARANVLPVAISEKKAYHADDAGQNARSIIEAMRREAERLQAVAEQAASKAIEKEAVRHTRSFAAGVRAQAQIDVSALLHDDDLANLISIRSEQFNGLIRSLSDDILNRIERETLGAIFEGRSNADIARAISAIDEIGRKRATLIARDQASKLNGAMNQFRQEQAGVRFYKWKTILDGRERPTHHANNGKVFAWAKAPATGHPGHEINCFPGSTRVTLSNGCHKLWRRFYSGPMVTIEASEGVALQATPNHPILTGRGWLAINDLQEGDYIVKVSKRLGVEYLDGDELVSTFAEMFETAARTKGSHAATMSPSDFHGDGTKGYVNAVVIDGLLPYGPETSSNHGVEQGLFARANVYEASALDGSSALDARQPEALWRQRSHLGMRGRGVGLPFTRAHSAHSDKVRRTPAAPSDAMLVQDAGDNDARNPKAACNGLFALSGAVASGNVGLGEAVISIGAARTSVHFGVEQRVPGAERLAEVAIGAAEQGRSFFESGALRYDLLCVVKKTVSEFAAHVYNLESSSGWYGANHIVAHNCRCRALAILTDDPEEIANEAAPAVEAEGELDPIATNEGLFERISSTPSQNVLAWAPDAIAARQAEVAQAQELVSQYRAAKSLTEADAEKLATVLYGSLPSDEVLAGLYGSRMLSAFVRRNTLLMNAISERLDLIERLLAHAAAVNATQD
jgi:SPP1 gp7 family putative phage head morphogenesis protein